MSNSIPLSLSPIRFGTDGWRGVLGVDFNLERLLPVAAAAAQELQYRAPSDLNSRTVVIGYDRRFLAPQFAEAIAAAVRGCELEPLLTETALPTPACSWAVLNRKALGALVVTASHNPPEWLGLKIKGPFGGSVDGDFTKAVEKRLLAGGVISPRSGEIQRFDARQEHLDCLKKKFDIPFILQGLKDMSLHVIIDPMHGSAAGCIRDLFGALDNQIIEEIREKRDPLFGGYPPEPLSKYLYQITKSVKYLGQNGKPTIGIVFDGDGDRIAAIDEVGSYCSTQLLMPLLIDHLARVKKLPGAVLKTVSGSDLMTKIAKEYNREVRELPVGFKYIAEQMLSDNILIGGEESGGIGFGAHLPERDALYTALLLLEALITEGKPLGVRLREIKRKFGDSHYDRFDLQLPDMMTRTRLEELLSKDPPLLVNQKPVKEVVRTDGVKLILDKFHWIMFRFSGTEPLLRIYSEAPNPKLVALDLTWAKDFAQKA